MIGEELIYEVKETLKEIYEKGFEIVDLWKKKYDGIPPKKSVNEIMVNPDLFNFSVFENFWKLFKMVSEDIDNALVQPWIRVIIEQSSDIFDYNSRKNDEKKKELACKYWLCALGFLGGKEGNLEYSDFLEFLQNKMDKKKFSDLKEKGYPLKSFHIEWDNLFARVNETEMPKIIEKYFLNIKGNPIKKHQIDRFYKDMSLYHHPNILITTKVEEELKDGSHMFRCFALLSICGMSLIRFAMDKELYDQDEEFIKKLNDRINSLFQKFSKTRDFRK